MFDKVKNWLGIEGVKIRFLLLKTYPKDVKTINGELEILSQSSQVIEGLRFKFIETYNIGKGKQRKNEEFILGTLDMETVFTVNTQEKKRIFFKIPFKHQRSNMDKLADKGPLRRGFVFLAKTFSKVESTYRVEAEAKIKGSNWTAFTQSTLDLS